MMDNPSVGFFVLDKKKSLRWYVLSPDQIWWLVVWLVPAMAIIFQWFDESLRPIGILFLFGSLFAWPSKRGIVYRNIQADIEQWFVERNGGVIFEGNPRRNPPLGLRISDFRVKSDQRAKKALIARDLDPEARQAFMDQDSSQVITLGTLYSSREGTDTAYVTGTGLKGTNGSPEDVFQARKNFATALTNTVSLVRNPADVCIIVAQRPMNILPDVMYDINNVDPAVQDARHLPLRDFGVDDEGRELLDVDTFFNGTTVEERQKAALGQAKSKASLTVPAVTQVIAVTARRPKYPGTKRGNFPKKGLSVRQLDRLPIRRLAKKLVTEATNAGITGARQLGYEDVTRFVHDGWDIDTTQDWQHKLLEWAVEVEKTGNSDLDIPSPWPDSIRIVQTPAQKNCIQMGSTYFRVRPAEAYHKPGFFAHDLLPLLDNSLEEFELTRFVSKTLTLCGDAIDMGAEYNMAIRKRVFERARQKNKEKGKEVFVTEKDMAKETALAAKSARLFQGGIYALNYNMFLTVGSPSLELIDDADDAIDALGTQVGVQFGVFDNQVRHVRSLVTALWGVNMVNR